MIGQPAFEPAIGAQQAGASEVELRRIGVLRIGDIGVHHELRDAHHVIVEHPVHHPGDGSLCRIGGDERGRAGVVHGEMVDDRGRLDHGGIAVRQHREFSRGVGLAHEIHIGGAIGRARIDIAKFEFGAVGVERDQRFPRVGGKAVAVERRHHQVPASIRARRAISRLLVAGSGALAGMGGMVPSGS